SPVPSSPGVRDAVVTVKEGRTGQFLVGAGVSSSAGLLGNVSYTERNFDLLNWPRSWKDVKSRGAWRGAGQTLRLSAEPGTEFMRFRIDWHEPFLFDKPYSLGTRLFLFTSARETYDEARYGTLVSLGHRFPNRWYAEVSGRVEGVRVDNLEMPEAPPDVRKVSGTTALAAAKGTLVRDKTDSRWMPSEGDRLTVSYEQVTGDFNFGKALAEYRTYYTVWLDVQDRKHIIAVRVSGGTILSEAPVFERFYGGGLGSVRGFQYRGISPRQGAFREVVGGEFMTFVGSEYTFPVFGQMLRGVVFIDTGTVESDVEITDYRASVGFGIRMHIWRFSPVPMSLDFAFPISKTSDDNEQLVSFSLGWVF
ncbi:hypothetical protein LCGC14_1226220, partial [marine sediment metagenome]